MAFKLRKPPRLVAKHEAYPYQLDAVRAIKDLIYSAVFHEQGLGKTKIAIDLMHLWLDGDFVDTVFIVTKKTLVQNWFDELESHSHITPKVLSGNRRENSIALNSPVLVYIMNYEVVSTNLDLFCQFLNTCRVAAVLDESQKIKNPDSKLATCFQSIAGRFSRRVIMTGTPVANRPYDLWSQIKFLDGGKSLGMSFDDFKATLDLPSNGVSVSEYGDQLSGVLEKIKPFSIRDTKRTAGLELPNKTILTHIVDLAPRQFEIYATYRNKMAYELHDINGLLVDDAADILKRLLRLVQCASNPMLVDKTYNEIPGKYVKLVELLNDIDLRSKKVIIWTGFVDNVEWLCNRLMQYKPLKIHGRMSIGDRNNSIRRFKTDKNSRVLLATPGAAKEGLTLTVANHAVFFDRGFSLDDYLQAQDRIHRISQTIDCFVHNLIGKETIDEWVDTLLNAKYQAAQLTQGDITQKEFDENFTADLSESLKVVLSTEHNRGLHRGGKLMKEIRILGETVTLSNDYHDINELKFLKDNPRVYACTHGYPEFENLIEEEQQEVIYSKLMDEPSVKNLIPDIKQHDGLMEPILIRYDTKEVIEGNSRLAVYRYLNSIKFEGEWNLIPCDIVSNLTDEHQAAFLNQVHVKGKTQWSAYEKANFAFVRRERGWDFNRIANLFGESIGTIRTRVNVIEMMRRNEDPIRSHFSYYDVLVRNPTVSSKMKVIEGLDSFLMREIKTLEVDSEDGDLTAQELRKKLPVILNKPKVLKRYMTGQLDLDDGYQQARTSHVEEKLKRAKALVEDVSKRDLSQLERNALNSFKQHVKKLSREIERIENMIEAIEV